MDPKPPIETTACIQYVLTSTWHYHVVLKEARWRNHMVVNEFNIPNLRREPFTPSHRSYPPIAAGVGSVLHPQPQSQSICTQFNVEVQQPSQRLYAFQHLHVVRTAQRKEKKRRKEKRPKQ
eukprot:TRINITY_DN264_c0_g2_i3.p2 TRINITY_DN264_c0_g2~~TRINITY_DN264_c0_g2_i3.p2  ORF type:complete len:121 (+),score=0.11 TRINITY_DN264_c0_g2_i3:372-734(+)